MEIQFLHMFQVPILRLTPSTQEKGTPFAPLTYRTEPRESYPSLRRVVSQFEI